MLRLEHEGWDFLLHGVFCFLVFSNLTYTGYMHFFGEHFISASRQRHSHSYICRRTQLLANFGCTVGGSATVVACPGAQTTGNTLAVNLLLCHAPVGQSAGMRAYVARACVACSMAALQTTLVPGLSHHHCCLLAFLLRLRPGNSG